MTDTNTPYGARFAQAWTALQAYLSDLDRDELADLATSDQPATIELLARQPELGSADALQHPEGLEPEELALRIVRERLDALDEQFGEVWGARFIAEWRRIGAPVSLFPYAVLQELKGSDREEALKLIQSRKRLSHALLKRLQSLDPEPAAALLFLEFRQAQTAAAVGFWPMAVVGLGLWS